MAKMKILFVVEAMGDGVFTYIVDLANELVKTYDMYIAYAVRPQTPKDYRTYFDPAIHLIEVKNFMRSINPLKDLKAILETKRIRTFLVSNWDNDVWSLTGEVVTV